MAGWGNGKILGISMAHTATAAISSKHSTIRLVMAKSFLSFAAKNSPIPASLKAQKSTLQDAEFAVKMRANYRVNMRMH
jgi:hypothetical protein